MIRKQALMKELLNDLKIVHTKFAVLFILYLIINLKSQLVKRTF